MVSVTLLVPFIFEFQRTGIAATTFLEKLDYFLRQLPTRYEYAVEVRNPRFSARNTAPSLPRTE